MNPLLLCKIKGTGFKWSFCVKGLGRVQETCKPFSSQSFDPFGHSSKRIEALGTRMRANRQSWLTFAHVQKRGRSGAKSLQKDFQIILTFCRFSIGFQYLRLPFKPKVDHFIPYKILVSVVVIFIPFFAMNKTKCTNEAENSSFIRMCTCSSVNRNDRLINMLSVIRNRADISYQWQH